MAEQFSFPGFEDEVATDRVFFAIMPDQAAVARIADLMAQLRRQHGLQGRAIAPHKLHVTLHHVGDFVGLPARVDAARRAAAEAVRAVRPFAVSLDRVHSFGGKPRHRPLVLVGGDGAAGLHLLHQALHKCGAASGGAYTPHLTLLYDDAMVAPQAVEAVNWSARELVLLRSRIGQNLPYDVLERWPL